MNKFTLRSIFTLALLLIFPSSPLKAFLQCEFPWICAPCMDGGRFYLRGTSSINWHCDQEFNNCDPDYKECREYKLGGGGSGALGYQWKCWEFEFETLIKYNTLDSVTEHHDNPSNDGTFSARGSTRDIAFMLNTFYHLPLNCGLGWYLGAGLGFSKNRIRLCSVKNVPTSPMTNCDTLFAWQLLTGMSYECRHCLELTGGYRLFSTEKPCSEKGVSACSIPYIHSLEAGLKYKF